MTTPTEVRSSSGEVSLPTTRLHRPLFVKVYEAKILKKAKGVFCTVQLGEKKCRTRTRWDETNPVFGDEFYFEAKGPRDLLQIILMVDDKKTQKQIGRFDISISSLKKRTSFDKWCQLFGESDRTPKGEIHIRVEYDEEVVLPTNSYEPLLELVTNSSLDVVQILEDVMRQSPRVPKTVMAIFLGKGKATLLLDYLIKNEIQNTKSAGTLFRGTSFATRAIDFLLKTVGRSYLTQTVQPIIRFLAKENLSCEIDERYLEEGEDVQRNIKNLLICLNVTLSKVFRSANFCPRIFRYFFERVQYYATQRFPSEENVKFTSVGGFMFLRFLVPCLLSPENYNLLDVAMELDSNQMRTLKLIGTTLQKLANLQLFSSKEAYWHELNSFLEQNFQPFKQFVTDLVHFQRTGVMNDVHSIDVAVHASELVNYILENREKFEKLTPQYEVIQKLLDIVLNLKCDIEKERKLMNLDKMRIRPLSRSFGKETANPFAEVDRLMNGLVVQQPVSSHQLDSTRPRALSTGRKVSLSSTTEEYSTPPSLHAIKELFVRSQSEGDGAPTLSSASTSSTTSMVTATGESNSHLVASSPQRSVTSQQPVADSQRGSDSQTTGTPSLGQKTMSVTLPPETSSRDKLPNPTNPNFLQAVEMPPPEKNAPNTTFQMDSVESNEPKTPIPHAAKTPPEVSKTNEVPSSPKNKRKNEKQNTHNLKRDKTSPENKDEPKVSTGKEQIQKPVSRDVAPETKRDNKSESKKGFGIFKIKFGQKIKSNQNKEKQIKGRQTQQQQQHVSSQQTKFQSTPDVDEGDEKLLQKIDIILMKNEIDTEQELQMLAKEKHNYATKRAEITPTPQQRTPAVLTDNTGTKVTMKNSNVISSSQLSDATTPKVVPDDSPPSLSSTTDTAERKVTLSAAPNTSPQKKEETAVVPSTDATSSSSHLESVIQELEHLTVKDEDTTDASPSAELKTLLEEVGSLDTRRQFAPLSASPSKSTIYRQVEGTAAKSESNDNTAEKISPAMNIFGVSTSKTSSVTNSPPDAQSSLPLTTSSLLQHSATTTSQSSAPSAPWNISTLSTVHSNSEAPNKRICRQCNEVILPNKQCILAGDAYYHLHHFVCNNCDSDLSFTTHFVLDGNVFCKRCYETLKKSEQTARCARCSNGFNPYTPKVLAMHQWWHPQCFTCCYCNKSLENSKFFPTLDNRPCCDECIHIVSANERQIATFRAQQN
jgi:hypothetical protein